jgi:hypothetical protein
MTWSWTFPLKKSSKLVKVRTSYAQIKRSTKLVKVTTSYAQIKRSIKLEKDGAAQDFSHKRSRLVKLHGVLK